MSDIAISVENLSKRYRIGLKEAMHDTLSGAISSWIKSPVLPHPAGMSNREEMIIIISDETRRQTFQSVRAVQEKGQSPARPQDRVRERPQNLDRLIRGLPC